MRAARCCMIGPTTAGPAEQVNCLLYRRRKWRVSLQVRSGKDRSLTFPSSNEFAKFPIPLALQLIEVDKAQRGRVDAVTHSACLNRAIGEDVPQVAVAVGRTHFGPNHPVARIAALDNVLGIDRLDKARPSGAAFKLVERGKKRLPRHDIYIESGFLIVPVLIREGPLGSVLLSHSIL